MTTRRNVLVTGGSRGIGLGLATRFRARGDRVLVTGRSAASLAAAAAACLGLETDAAVAGIDAGDDVIGFGVTAGEDVVALVAAQRRLFDGLSGRFPVASYASRR